MGRYAYSEFPISITYLRGGVRVEKKMASYAEAKRLFIQKIKANADPKIVVHKEK